jgi:hypothetical protein
MGDELMEEEKNFFDRMMHHSGRGEGFLMG